MTLDYDSSTLNSIILILVALFFVTFSFLPDLLFSKLLWIEYKEYPSEWEKDGKPHGIPYWYPPGHLFSIDFDPYFNRKKLEFSWLFMTPEWVKGHPTARKLLKGYRIVIGCCFLFFFLLICSFSTYMKFIFPLFNP